MASITRITNDAGKVKYRVQVRVAGCPAKHATFSKYGDAKRWAADAEWQLKINKPENQIKAQHSTINELIERYIDRVLTQRGKSQHYMNCQKQRLAWWKEEIGNYTVSTITPYALNDCIEKLYKADYEKGTIACYVAALNHAFSVAYKKWGWLDANPLDKIEKVKPGSGRVRFLSNAELMKLLAACRLEKRKPLFLIVMLAIGTGARKSEILNLKRKNIDLQRGVAIAYETKNKDPRQLYLSDVTKPLLEAHLTKTRYTRPAYVFSQRNSPAPINIDTEWRRARERAGIVNFRFHDLRHTAASYMAMTGATPEAIAEALGHKNYDMVKRYAHLSTTHISNVVRSMNDRVFNQQQGDM
jgi:integrase